MATSMKALLAKLKASNNRVRERRSKYSEIVENVETRRYNNGAVKHIIYTTDGKLHRRDGPAYQRWDTKGNLLEERWCILGLDHREQAPAHQVWTSSGVLITEQWYRHNRLHRRDGPAETKWYASGAIESEKWYKFGIMHREGDWAEKQYSRMVHNKVVLQCWWEAGVQTRDDGPGYMFFTDGYSQLEEDGVGYTKNGYDITEDIVMSGCEPFTDEFKFTWDMISPSGDKL